MTMRYSYFPGCSAESTGRSFTKSAAYVNARIGFTMVEIPDWNCCGTSAAALTSPELAVALPARSLALSEKVNPGLDVVAPCAGCYKSLKAAVNFARESAANLEHVRDLLQMPYEASADVVSLLEAYCADDVRESIAGTIARPLRTLRVACYYGCALVRPASVAFDDPEDPQGMDDLMSLIGAEPVDWAFKTECCGASQTIPIQDIAVPLIERIFENAAANGADCIVTACPLCQLNLDMRVEAINEKRRARGKKPFDIPCYYFTELIALAQGAGATDAGLDIHFHPAEELIQRRAADAVALAESERAAAEEEVRKKAEIEAKLAAKRAEKEAAAKEKAAEASAIGEEVS